MVKTLQAIESANVVLLLLDATQGVTDQDAHIAGYILESGRAVVLAINKSDAVDSYQRELLERSIETRLGFLKFAAIHRISATKRQGLGPVWKSIIQAHASANRKMSTPVLTRLLLEAVWRLSAQDALCASGRDESTDHHHSRKFPGACHRVLQALPGGAVSKRV